MCLLKIRYGSFTVWSWSFVLTTLVVMWSAIEIQFSRAWRLKSRITFSLKKKKIMANGSIEPVHIRKCCKSDYSPKYRWSWLSSCRSSDIIFLILKSHVVAQSAELCCRRQLKCVSQWTFRHDWVRIQHNQCSSCQDGWQGETKHSPADFGFCLGVISFPASSLSAAQL